ncbi:hypothetical protein BWO91_17595 [Plantibacter flavus]|uniref:hypothetical protein n=1 Tax=Plantibacter flavus TaxID=150123 RepID=UPI00099D1FFE|nr:hypothetical protein [Plantibacter flavus]AQX81535.1 hypothetical protein BWO91_17595 [Plantibacter flavus]
MTQSSSPLHPARQDAIARMAYSMRADPVESPDLILQLVAQYAELTGRTEGQSIEVLMRHLIIATQQAMRRAEQFDRDGMPVFFASHSRQFKVAYLAYIREEANQRQTLKEDARPATLGAAGTAGAPRGGKK